MVRGFADLVSMGNYRKLVQLTPPLDEQLKILPLEESAVLEGLSVAGLTDMVNVNIASLQEILGVHEEDHI